MSRPPLSFFVLVPGPWTSANALVELLVREGLPVAPAGSEPLRDGEIRVDIVEDPHLAEGFRFGARGALDEEVVARVGETHRAALLEVAGTLDDRAETLADLGSALQAAGGVAVRMESSGAASEWEPFLDRLRAGSPRSLLAAAVFFFQDGEGGVFTCGMHLFGLPDVEIRHDDVHTSMEWAHSFSAFLLAEAPLLASGHTFRPDLESERRTLERWPDTQHHPHDGRHNPFGIWRFLPPGAEGLEVSDTVPVAIPSLFAILTAAEREAGEPLGRSDVEQIVSDSTVVAMTLADAVAMERSRGYLDLEPRRAWEQWQATRPGRENP